MAAFFIGLGLAVVIAVIAGFGLQGLDQSTSKAFYTRYTVPLDNKTPTGGRLAHSHLQGEQGRAPGGDQPR